MRKERDILRSQVHNINFIYKYYMFCSNLANLTFLCNVIEILLVYKIHLLLQILIVDGD